MATSQLKFRQSIRAACAPARQRGFSLIELMIAITIGLFLISGMALIFVNSVQSRTELDKSSRQIENGRYAAQALREDVELAGFYGDYLPPLPTTGISPGPVGWTTPDPCALVLNNMGFNVPATSPISVPVGIYGYSGTTALPTTCDAYISNRKSGTDALVVRRVSTAALKIDADENGSADTTVTNDDGTAGVSYASLGGSYYLQVSNCSDEQPAKTAFVMDRNTANFTLHRVRPMGTPATCSTGALSPLRKYMVRIFYISTCNDCSGSGDGIPTLMTADLTGSTSTCTDPAAICGSLTVLPVAEGIENLQFEYGLDDNLDGVPDRFVTDPSDTTTNALPVTVPATASNWQNVVAVKIFLLARNALASAGYVDSKTYSLSSDGAALSPSPAASDPATGGYKRHVYFSYARAVNIGGRREQ